MSGFNDNSAPSDSGIVFKSQAGERKAFGFGGENLNRNQYGIAGGRVAGRNDYGNISKSNANKNFRNATKFSAEIPIENINRVSGR